MIAACGLLVLLALVDVVLLVAKHHQRTRPPQERVAVARWAQGAGQCWPHRAATLTGSFSEYCNLREQVDGADWYKTNSVLRDTPEIEPVHATPELEPISAYPIHDWPTRKADIVTIGGVEVRNV